MDSTGRALSRKKNENFDIWKLGQFSNKSNTVEIRMSREYLEIGRRDSASLAKYRVFFAGGRTLF